MRTMKLKNLLYRNVNDLTVEEKVYFMNNEHLNSCDKYNTIHLSTDLYWSDEYDLKGNYAALCEEAFKEIGGTRI